MQSLKSLLGCRVTAADGGLGKVQDLLVDVSSWRVAYALLPSPGILSGGRTALNLWHCGLPQAGAKAIPTSLTIEQARDGSPTVLGQFEEARERRFGGKTGRADGVPVEAFERRAEVEEVKKPTSSWESLSRMLEYSILASERRCGSVGDLLFEPGNWEVLYLVAESWPWKRKGAVLVPIDWVKDVNWAKRAVQLSASPEALESDPSLKPASHC